MRLSPEISFFVLSPRPRLTREPCRALATPGPTSVPGQTGVGEHGECRVPQELGRPCRLHRDGRLEHQLTNSRLIHSLAPSWSGRTGDELWNRQAKEDTKCGETDGKESQCPVVVLKRRTALRTPWSEGGTALWTGSWNHAEETVPHQRVTAKRPDSVRDSDSTPREPPKGDVANYPVPRRTATPIRLVPNTNPGGPAPDFNSTQNLAKHGSIANQSGLTRSKTNPSPIHLVKESSKCLRPVAICAWPNTPAASSATSNPPSHRHPSADPPRITRHRSPTTRLYATSPSLTKPTASKPETRRLSFLSCPRPLPC